MTTNDDAAQIGNMAEKSGTIGLETVSQRGLAALQVVHRRAPHASPGDTGV